jgi:hypothetical protein
MRRLGSTTLVLAALLLYPAGPAFAAQPYEEVFDQTYPLEAAGRVALSNADGSVKVNVWDQEAVRVQAVKKAESWYGLKHLTIQVISTPSFVKIESHYPKARHGDLSVEYTLTVPWGAMLDTIDLVNGSLIAADLGGDLTATLVNGAATLTGMGGDVAVRTINGGQHVVLDVLSFCQRVELQTVNGPIDVRLGPAVSAKVRAEALIGTLRNEFGLPVTRHGFLGAVMIGSIGSDGGRLRLRTVNGAISVGRL